MPTVTVDLFRGRSLETKRELANKITQVITETCNCPPEAVTVKFVEGERENLAKGGVLYCDK